MRALTTSLLIVTLLTILTLGWMLDRLFLHYASEPDTTQTLEVYRDIGQQIATMLDTHPQPGKMILQWPDNPTVALNLLSEESFPVPENLLTNFRDGEPLVLESDSDVTIYYYLPSHGQIVSLTPLNMKPARDSSLRLLLTMVFYIGVGALLLAWLYPLIKRLLALRHSAVEFGKGHLDSRVSIGGLSYITDIETEFNRMADRIQALVTDNRLLSSAVSHDLRTPLARLRFGIDTLSETPAGPAQDVYIERLSNDIDAMEKLVNSLLSFARLDHVLATAKFHSINIATLVEECVSLYADDTIEVTTRKIDSATINGNTDFLGMLTNNLLQNAVTHARSKVRVSLVAEAGSIILSVADDGPGIPPEQREAVMMPFQRGVAESVEPPHECKQHQTRIRTLDQTQAHDQIHDQNYAHTPGTGHGLGLAIVARLAQWHEATVTVTDSAELAGAHISVSFPEA